MKHLLFAIGLVATLASCSKKEEPAPELNTGRYQRDGQTVTCTATAILMPPITGLSSYEILQVALTTTPQPATGAEVLYVNYYRIPGPGAAVSSFFLKGCALMRDGSQYTYTVYEAGAYSLTSTSSGGYSGTFAGTIIAPSASAISGGVFTDVRQKP